MTIINNEIGTLGEIRAESQKKKAGDNALIGLSVEIRTNWVIFATRLKIRDRVIGIEKIITIIYENGVMIIFMSIGNLIFVNTPPQQT